MTTIIYTGDGITVDGHADNPIVCHGISAISQMVANYVEDKGWGTVLRSDGHLEIIGVDKKYFENDLFAAMGSGFQDIEKSYPQSLKIIYK